VKPLSFTISGNTATAPLEVQPWAGTGLLEFNVALPPGEITSATLSEITLTESTAQTSAPVGSATAAENSPVTVSVRPLGYIRGHRVVKLQFGTAAPGHPGANIRSGRLSINYAAEIQNAQFATAAGPVAEILSDFVANPADLQKFAMALTLVPEPQNDHAPPLGDATAGARAHFTISKPGFVAFTGSDLTSAGLDISAIPTDRLSVWTEGQQQPVWHQPATPGATSVQAGDRFIVYARDNSSTYTAARTYWIKTDTRALPMARRTLTAAPANAANTAYFMANQIIQKDVPPVLTKNDQFLSILDYRWVWWTWTGAGPAAEVPNPHSYNEPGTAQFDLPALAPSADVSSSITLNFYAHHWAPQSPAVPFEITLNGTSIGEAVVSGSSGLRQSYAVPAAVLKASANQLELMPIVTSATATMPDICFDRLEITYPRTYTLTSPTLEFAAPVTGEKSLSIAAAPGSFVADITTDQPTIWATQDDGRGQPLSVPAPGPGETFVAVTPAGLPHAELIPYKKSDDLRTHANTADLVVIAWPDFIPTLQPWLDAKRAAGYTPRVVSVFDIYDQFGYGHLSPHAIRAFIRYAATNWKPGAAGPAASSIVLVGDSTSAYRDEFRNDVINYVPTMRLAGNGDSFASDQWYASIFGNDPYPDALIGRFSVNSVTDLQRVIAKQLQYAGQSTPAPWQNTLGFIADHSEFEDAVNRVMKQAVPPRFFLNRVFMSDLPWVDNFYFPRNIADAQQAKVSTEATGRIRDMFNDGAAVVTYFGHGSPNVWSSERMWFGGDSPNSDNLLLTNRDRLAIVINMTCNSGAIDYPQPRWNVCISEDFMRVENGGAVACFVPSGPGLTVQHERLMMEIGATLFTGAARPMGEDLQLALWRYLAHQNPPELARMYILLGDPLLVPQISRPAPVEAEDASPQPEAGFVMLPQSSGAARHAQVNAYNAGIEAGEIQTIQPGARLVKIPASPNDEPRTIAISAAAAEAGTSLTQSKFIPLNSLAGVRLLQWRRTDDTARDDSAATIQFRIKNDSPIPVPGVAISLMASDCTTCSAISSEPQDIPRFSDGTFNIDVPLQPGLNHFSATLANASQHVQLGPDPPITVAGLRPDGAAGKTYPPAVIDPASTQVRYRHNPDGVSATISLRAFILARETLTNLGLGAAGPDGIIAPESTVPVSAVAAGASAPISLSVDLPPRTSATTYTLQFDPAGYFPEFRRFAPASIILGSESYPDLAITAITSPEPSATDGETIFFDITITNKGHTAVDGVRVKGTRILPSGLEEKLESQVKLDTSTSSLQPGTSDTIRLRWDPFQNAGENHLRFEAESIYNVPDRNPQDNRVDFPVKVRSKARLQKGKLHVAPPTAEDRQQRQIRIIAEIHNAGETDAHGLRVRFFGAPEMNATDLLGEADVDVIPAGQTRQATITYKLKPGEENRKFRLAYEVLYKGARQRIPMD
jgi:uncharacterized repeat protein (TIGR01451 family)